MRHLRLVSSHCPDPQPEPLRSQASHPCLEAFQVEFDYLIRSLQRLGVSRQDVEDLAQEVFLILYQTWEKYDPTRPLRAYLFGIAFRVAATHLRKRRREIPHAVTDASDLGPRPDQTLESKQARALVLSALEKVPLQRRAVLIMHDIDRLPMREIASALSIYRFTGYSRLRKAREEFAAAVVSLRGASER
ncbi:MAG: sigma-70 family RNA polymerase sigma factor [Polyangiaceae bacterium]|nr:sigma-70 family RNA polymerase sigma factor [Polyangiaceae bacterium]